MMLLKGENQVCEVLWERLWKSKLHDRLKIFLWRLASNVLPVKSLLANRLGRGETDCYMCGQGVEDAIHIFCDCSVSRSLAFACKWGLRLDSLAGNSPKELVFNLLVEAERRDGDLKVMIMACFLYSIWMFRNNTVFGRGKNFSEVVMIFELSVEEFIASGKLKIRPEPHQQQAIPWAIPSSGVFAINVDVAISGGVSAAAMVVRNDEGKLVYFASFWGEETEPAKAELEALVWAARVAGENGWECVDWRSDAQAVVNEIRSLEDPCGWETRYLILFVRRLFSSNRGWFLHWVPRMANRCADLAAKFKM